MRQALDAGRRSNRAGLWRCWSSDQLVLSSSRDEVAQQNTRCSILTPLREQATLPPGYKSFQSLRPSADCENHPFIKRPSTELPSSVRAESSLVYAHYGSRQMHLDLFAPKAKGTFRLSFWSTEGAAWITTGPPPGMENPLRWSWPNGLCGGNRRIPALK